MRAILIANVLLMVMGEDQLDVIALANRVRQGDDTAFAELYQRFLPFARHVANRIVADGHDADDLVHEAFYMALRSLRAGGGPTESFAGYVASTVRRLAYQHVARQKRLVPTENLDMWDHAIPDGGPSSKQLDDAAVAWETLPDQWRGVLWQIEVARYLPSELAPGLGVSPNAVSSLAARARVALRTAYLTQQLAGDEPDGCAPLLPRLAAFARGAVSERWRRKLTVHVGSCAPCDQRLSDLRVRAGRLAVS